MSVKKKKDFSKIFSWLIPLIGVLTLGFTFWRDSRKKPKDKDKNASEMITGSPDQVSFVIRVAKEVAKHLGVSYPVYDPRRWTENDKEVFDLLKDLTSSQYLTVSKLYADVYAKGRVLSQDLSKMLDDEYFKQLKNI